MPWMNVVTSKTFSGSQQGEIKMGFAAIMQRVLDKKETGLNVTFITADNFFRAGESATDAAAIEIKYINPATAPQKQEIADAIADLMAGVGAYDPTKVIVLFSEFLAEDYCRQK